jgi:hypothetical protein
MRLLEPPLPKKALVRNLQLRTGGRGIGVPKRRRMTLPNFMLRRLSMPGGVRLAKQTAFVDAEGICPSCKKPVLNKKIMDRVQLDGLIQGDNVYHYRCWSDICCERHPTTILGPAMKYTRQLVPGNLGREEYRFWIGSKQNWVGYATCRACRMVTYSSRERTLHFDSEAFTVGGDKCSTRLVNAYKNLLCVDTCMICKKQRFGHQKWGIPICEQLNCIEAWMFGDMRWMGLEMELHAQKVAAEKKSAGIVAVGLPALPGDRPWCRDCRMYTDNDDHARIHARRAFGAEWGGEGIGD